MHAFRPTDARQYVFNLLQGKGPYEPNSLKRATCWPVSWEERQPSFLSVFLRGRTRALVHNAMQTTSPGMTSGTEAVTALPNAVGWSAVALSVGEAWHLCTVESRHTFSTAARAPRLTPGKCGFSSGSGFWEPSALVDDRQASGLNLS